MEYCLEHLGSLAKWYAERDKNGDRSKLDALACHHFERYLVRPMVERCGGHMAEATRRLGLSDATVKNKMSSG